MTSDLNEIKQYCFHDSVVSNFDKYFFENGSNYIFIIKADFCEDEALRTGLKSFNFSFEKIEEFSENGNIENYDGASVLKFDIERTEKKHFIDIFLESEPEKCSSIKIRCEKILLTLMKYRGMSYRNLYNTPELNAVNKKMLYAEAPEYLKETKSTILPDGFVLETKIYSDISGGCANAWFSKNILMKNSKTVFDYYNFDGHHRPFSDFICHSNGHKYYSFYVDLYGICFLDINTLENYCYVPEGWEHDFSYPCGESFIITDIHYDKNTNLAAFEGCYWADISSVMIGDLSNPLSFNPRFIDIHDLGIDPDYDDGFDFDFLRWSDSSLFVKDDNGKEYEIPIHKIKQTQG